jgi:hypothetical protein
MAFQPGTLSTYSPYHLTGVNKQTFEFMCISKAFSTSGLSNFHSKSSFIAIYKEIVSFETFHNIGANSVDKPLSNQNFIGFITCPNVHFYFNTFSHL